MELHTEEEKSKEDIKRKVTRFLKFLGTVLAGYFFGCDRQGVKGRFVSSVENAKTCDMRGGTFAYPFNHGRICLAWTWYETLLNGRSKEEYSESQY